MEAVYGVTHSSTLPTTILQTKATGGGWMRVLLKKICQPIASYRGTSQLDSVFKCQWLHCQQLHENDRMLKWRQFMALPIFLPFPLLYCKRRPPKVANLRVLRLICKCSSKNDVNPLCHFEAQVSLTQSSNANGYIVNSCMKTTGC